MTRRALSAVALAAAAAFAAAGCGGGDDEDATLPAGPLNVYVSVPTHGPPAVTGRAVTAGARLALRDAGGRAGGRPIRIVPLAANRPGDLDWDPGTVEANAKRAADDPRAIAYVGEAERGASAVSVPRTNDAGLLQVSPMDGLTSLTRRPPGRPRAGPERYYPSERRSFAREVPTDARVARQMLAMVAPEPDRRIALVDTPDFAAREMGAVLDAGLRRAGAMPVAHLLLKDDPEAVPDRVRDLAATRPQAVLVAGEPGPVARSLLAELTRQVPDAEVVASPGLAGTAGEGSGAVAVTGILPASAQSAEGQRVLRRLGPRGRVDALYGYEAMRTVLRAVRRGGPDRAAVIRGALAGTRRGDVAEARVALVPLDGGQPRVRVLGP